MLKTKVMPLEFMVIEKEEENTHQENVEISTNNRRENEII